MVGPKTRGVGGRWPNLGRLGYSVAVRCKVIFVDLATRSMKISQRICFLLVTQSSAPILPVMLGASWDLYTSRDQLERFLGEDEMGTYVICPCSAMTLCGLEITYSPQTCRTSADHEYDQSLA